VWGAYSEAGEAGEAGVAGVARVAGVADKDKRPHSIDEWAPNTLALGRMLR
jgi:hypothetical protein